MQVMDLRNASTPSPPRVTARASGAAELLRVMSVLVDEDPSTYDIGAGRIAEVRAAMPGELLGDLRAVLPRQQDDRSLLVLSLLAATLPDPAGVRELVDALRAEPRLAWRALLAHRAQELDEPDIASGWNGLLEGDEAALARIRARAGTTAGPAGITTLLAAEPEAFGLRLLDVVERFVETVWEGLADEAMGPIGRDAEHRTEQLGSGADAADALVAATQGFELPDDPRIREVVLLPSYWLRPWLVVGNIGDDGLAVLSTPVADEFVALPSEAPPPSLPQLLKALSDAGRLQLLRRMTVGPISLGDAAAELHVAKATAHHHLTVLRQAGLVSVRGEGRSIRHGLREDPAGLVHEALSRYVPPVPAGRSPASGSAPAGGSVSPTADPQTPRSRRP